MANIADPMWEHAHAHPDRVALRTSTEDVTYGELGHRAARFGARLRDRGVQPGERVVLIAPTCPEFVVAYLGSQMAGAIVVTVSTMATAPEIDWILIDSQAVLVIEWHTGAAGSVAAGERGVEHLALARGAGADPGATLAQPIARDIDDTTVLLYTSGTTGKPKGVELTIGNLGHTARVYTEQLGICEHDRLGTGLPLFHVFGQVVALMTALNTGCPFSLLHPFTPTTMLELIRDHQLTIVAGVPTMWIAMLHAGDQFGTQDLLSLRLAASGGAALPREVIRAFADRFGCTILEGYGLTESTGAATYTSLDGEHPLGSAGQPLPGTDIEIRGADGARAAVGEVGEIHLRGPSIMKGYWQRPDATATELSEGWLKTGDLGYLDHQQHLFIVGRLKEMIIRGGYNVYPREVEEVLYQHPGIAQVAVIGVADSHYGQEVAAVVVLQPDHEVSAEEIRTWAKGRLSAYKVPHRFAFVDQLPVGPTGKILKRSIDPALLSEPGGD
ncbi:class I adenylate-forming enzyme family protein [Nocardia niwae]|uniref:AMP-binding protein n=1 Tax=Nocardia niwae TaxID=626084 RepID=A0ABV2XCL2_9NOCA